MQAREHIRSISYLKSHAAQISEEVAATGAPVIITQNGEAKLVVQDVRTYESTQQTIALLKILAIGQKHIERGDHADGDEFFAELNELDQQEKLR